MHKAVRSAAKLAVEVIGLTTPRGRLFAISTLAVFLSWLGPRRLEGGPTLCLISRVIGRPCPACGMTRAMAALLRGEIGTAADYNRLVFPAAFSLLFILIEDIQKVISKNF